MHARLGIAKVKPDRMDDLIEIYNEHQAKATPEARQGHHFTYALIDRERNEFIVFAAWDTEEGVQQAAASAWNQSLRRGISECFVEEPDRRILEIAYSG